MADPAHQRPDILAVESKAPEGAEQPRHDHLDIADDAQRNRLRQGHGAADGEHGIADVDLR